MPKQEQQGPATLTLRISEIEITGVSEEQAREIAERYAQQIHWDLFSTTWREDQGKLIATYTNPNIPWLSAGEPLQITITE